MKRSVKCAVTILLAVFLVCTLCACSSLNGLSAYEIAVKNGFEGTETEWLQSLQTQSVVTENNVTYTVEGSAGNVVAASNIGLKSVVSVYSNFTKVTMGGSWMHPQQEEVSYSQAGAGVIFQLESDGSAFIITNHHVVYSADSTSSNKISNEIYILLYGMESTEYAIAATYVGGTMYYDIAVLRVENSQLLQKALENGAVAAAQFADSEQITAGQTSIAIGNPAAEGISVSSGIISVASEYITMTAVDEKTTITLRVVRTDTAVNSGNSGGGLFDASGNLIGIVNAKMNTSTAENIAYAIPSNLVKAVAQNIIENCYYSSNTNLMRAMLGVTVQASDISVAPDQSGALRTTETVTVAEVSSGGAADGVLQQGDVLQAVTIDQNTTQLTKTYMLAEALLYASEGDTVTLQVLRNGQQLTLQIQLTSSDITAY